jgi:NADH-quinone oxidoreductase subunit C
MIPHEILNTLASSFPGSVLEMKSDGVHDPFARVDPGKLRAICEFLRDDEKMGFDALMCLSGVHNPDGTLGVVYHLNSTTWNHKIALKVSVPVEHPHCPSVESVWKTANWHEREAYDLFGIVFDGHPDLRRILLPDDWEGYPLRKDYTLPQYYRGMKVPY